MTSARSGNPVKGALLLTAILFGLIWLPLIGPFVAGVVGGLNSGSRQGAIIAWAVPSFLITVFAVLLSVLTPMGANPIFLFFVLFHMGIVLIGAIAGGAGAGARD